MSDPFNLRERLSEIKPSAFEFYGLASNPFPMSGVAPEHPKVFAARKKAYHRISDFIIRTYKSKKWSGLVEIAEYGNGKTHTLKLVRDRINQEIGTTPTGKCLALYIENLGDDLNDFYFEFIREIGFSLFLELLWKILSETFETKIDDSAFLNRLKPRQATLRKKVNLKSFFSSPKTLKLAVSKEYLSREKILSLVKAILKKVISNENLLKCCSVLVIDSDDKMVDSSWRYISGLSLTLTEYKKLELDKKSITSEEISQEVFGNILEIFRKNSYTNLYLLIDEIEDVIPIPKQRKRELLGGLRRIIDNNQQNLMIIIATTMAGWLDLQKASPPLADRFPIVVELPPLNPSETEELIRDYLELVRINGKKASITPFTKELIANIWKKSGGNLRKVLEMCYDLLEKGAYKKARTLDSSLFVE